MPPVFRNWHKVRRDAGLADLNRSIVQPHHILDDNMGQDGLRSVVIFESNAEVSIGKATEDLRRDLRSGNPILLCPLVPGKNPLKFADSFLVLPRMLFSVGEAERWAKLMGDPVVSLEGSRVPRNKDPKLSGAEKIHQIDTINDGLELAGVDDFVQLLVGAREGHSETDYLGLLGEIHLEKRPLTGHKLANRRHHTQKSWAGR